MTSIFDNLASLVGGLSTGKNQGNEGFGVSEHAAWAYYIIGAINMSAEVTSDEQIPKEYGKAFH